MSEGYERSSGSGFADLGYPDPDPDSVKAKLAFWISSTIEALGWSDPHAARELGIDGEAFAALTRGRVSAFSTDDLLGLLTRLNLDVDIEVGPNVSSARRARIAVHSHREPIAAGPRANNHDAVRFD